MLNEDYKDTLRALVGENARFLLVGAYAMATHVRRWTPTSGPSLGQVGRCRWGGSPRGGPGAASWGAPVLDFATDAGLGRSEGRRSELRRPPTFQTGRQTGRPSGLGFYWAVKIWKPL